MKTRSPRVCAIAVLLLGVGLHPGRRGEQAAEAGVRRVRPVAAVETSPERVGAVVRLPLMDGRVVVGRVNLVREEDGGRRLLGGGLEEGGGFALAFGPDGLAAGLVLPAGEGPVYRLLRADDGGALLAEVPRASVLCASLPRPPGRTGAAGPERRVRTMSASATMTVPALDSRPEAEPVLFLDFDGEVVNDPVWNRGLTIEAAPSGLSEADILRVWRKVAEDYRPFALNVTTDPARYAAARPMLRMRCIITPTRDWYGEVGGVALIFSWRDAGASGSVFARDVPCWVFSEPGVMGVDDIALAVSHEAGHTFGLFHDGLRGEDGTTPPEGDYFSGHGEGSTAWGPIMGAPYGKPLIQWSRGDYAVGARVANNPEDDLALIATVENHLAYAAEDRAATADEARRLRLLADGVTVDHAGLIGRSGGEAWLLVATGAGPLELTLGPEHADQSDAGNLDAALTLTTLAGAPLAEADARGTRFPVLRADVPGGTHVLRVRSVGEGSPTDGGYSAYGSLGAYRVRGTIPAPGAVAPRLGGAVRIEGRAGVELDVAIEAAGAGLVYAASGLPPGLTVRADGRLVGAPTEHGVWRATLHASNAHGVAAREVEFAIAGATLAEALDARALVFVSGGERPWTSRAEPEAPRGGSHARSGLLVDNLAESWLETEVVGPGRMRWCWRVSSETNYDFLVASLDGAQVASISGPRGWAEFAVDVPAGAHRVRWTYEKDDYLSAHEDAAWVDDVRWERGFERWSAAAGLGDDETRAGERADPDGDGVANLLEYAFARDPLAADGLGESVRLGSAGVAAGAAAGALELVFVRPADRADLRYVVEASPDLIAWRRGHAYADGESAEPTGPGPAPTVERERVALPGGGERIRVGAFGGPTERRFLRVRVERR